MSHREGYENYDKVIAQLGPNFRLIECKDGHQWILQEKKRHNDWRSLKFFMTRAGVIRRIKGLPGWEALNDNLPDRFKPLVSRRGTACGAAT